MSGALLRRIAKGRKMSGAKKDYDFPQKRHFRRWLWNRIAERTPNRRDAICLYLPGEEDLDRPIAIERGFSPNNFIGVERNAESLSSLREEGAFAINADFFWTARSLASKRRVDVIYGDLCCGYYPRIGRDLAGLLISPFFRTTAFAVNLMRGRDKGDLAGKIFEQHIRISGQDVRMHRGAQLLLSSLLLLAVFIKREVEKIHHNAVSPLPFQLSDLEIKDGEGTEIIKDILFLYDLCRPEFTSYMSDAGQKFDSVVFSNPLAAAGIPLNRTEEEAWYAKEVKQREKLFPKTKENSKDWRERDKAKKSAAAIMAHRTMRLAKEQ